PKTTPNPADRSAPPRPAPHRRRGPARRRLRAHDLRSSPPWPWRRRQQARHHLPPPTGEPGHSAGFSCSSPEAVAGLLRRRRAAATALGRGSRAAVLQFAELGLEVGLQPGAVFALEGAKRLDLLLQRVLLLRDVAHHLG